MKRFFVLGFSSSKAETISEVIDSTFNSGADFVGIILILRISDSTWISTKNFFRINVKHIVRIWKRYINFNNKNAVFMRFMAFSKSLN